MNCKEMLISVAGKEIKVFMQPGFFCFSNGDTRTHKNAYTELHCIEKGTMEYIINGNKFLTQPGDLIIIPSGVFHSKRILDTEDHSTCIFQVDIKAQKVLWRKLSPDIFTELIKCVREYNSEGKTMKLSSYLALICSYVLEDFSTSLKNVQDRKFQIYEFFYNNYHLEVQISDLAKILNLSQKQTERSVLKYTGRHFRNELAYRRIEAAKHILKTENITIREAAERVGYKSYSGFWKAFKIYGSDGRE